MLHRNHHSMVDNFLNICYLIKLLTNKSAFHKLLEKDSNKSLLPDLFVNSTISWARRVVLTKYIINLWGNWETKKSSYNTGSKDDNIVKGENDTIERWGRDLKKDDNIDN